MPWKSALLCSLVWLQAIGCAIAADFVVIASSAGSGVPARGDSLGADRNLLLKDGQEIIAIQQNGEVLRISGPYVGFLRDHPSVSGKPETDGGVSALNVISSLLKEDGLLIPTLGSTRDPRSQEVNSTTTSPWEPYIIGTGVFCIHAGYPVVRRQNTNKQIKVTLTSPDFMVTNFVWRIGQTKLEFDGGDIKENTTYYLLLSDRLGDSSIITRPANLGGNAAVVIAWLSKKGCIRQALRLVDQLSQTAK